MTFEGLIDQSRVEKAKVIRATPNSVRRMKRTRWVWYPFVPLGEIVILTGATDLGKSTICIDIAGAVTRGKLNGQWHGVPQNVLYVAFEDTIEVDITPKLVATDADRDLFWDVEVKNGSMYLPEDIGALQELVDQTSAKVIFIDPISSVIRGDQNKAEIVRPALESIRDFASKNGVAVIGVRHQRKGNTGGATEGISGSNEWANISRCALAVKENREQPGQFVTSITKNNRAPRSERINLLYTFEHVPVELDDGEEPQLTPKIKWLGETALDVNTMMEEASNGARSGDVGDATAWLEAYMADQGGEAAQNEIYKAGKAVGLSEATITAARGRLKLPSSPGLDGIVWRLS